MYDVVSVGILVADAMANPIMKMPDKGKLELVGSIGLYTGGNAATCAINVSKLGLKSAVLGKIGQDGFGRFVDSELRLHGVDTRGLCIDPNGSIAEEPYRISLLGGVAPLKVSGADAQGKKTILTAIPYYSWANRSKGAMRVWLPVVKG